MTDRMRRKAGDALATLRTLAERGWYVQHFRNGTTYTVEVGPFPNPNRGTRYYDAGTLDDALLQIDLEQYPRRAA